MRCVCGHIRSLHKDGVCQARIRVCGCTSYETPQQADIPSGFVKTTTYTGFYAKSYRLENK